MSFTPQDSNTFTPIGIKKSDDKLTVLDTHPIPNNTNNISLHSSSNDTNVDILSIKTLLNKDQNKELQLSAFDGSSINPIIKINNTHQHVNITSNLNVASNLNVTNKINMYKPLIMNEQMINLYGASDSNHYIKFDDGTGINGIEISGYGDNNQRVFRLVSQGSGGELISAYNDKVDITKHTRIITDGSTDLQIIAGTQTTHIPKIQFYHENDKEKGIMRYLPDLDIFEIRQMNDSTKLRLGNYGLANGVMDIENTKINMYKQLDMNSEQINFQGGGVTNHHIKYDGDEGNGLFYSGGGAGGSFAHRFYTTNGTGSEILSMYDNGVEIKKDTQIDGNVGIGTQNPQSKLDVNGDIQFKSHNEFNNISDFYPGYYKSISSGTNIGLPTDYSPTGTEKLEELKTVRYNDMKISMTGKTIYTNVAIYDNHSSSRSGHDVWTNLNSVNKNGYYFQLTGTGLQTWDDNSSQYIVNDIDNTAVWDRAKSDTGSIIIDLEDKNQNPMAVYRNKFTEISFDVSFTALNGTSGDALFVNIKSTNDDSDLFYVVMKSYTHYQFINFFHLDMGSVGDYQYLVSSDKLLFNKKNLTDINGDTFDDRTQTAADNLRGTFFNIKIVFNDDEWALYFDNKIVKTDISQVDKGGTNGIATGNGPGNEIKRTLNNTFKNYVNNSSYNRLRIHYSCGASYARCHVKNIQIKSGFGCYIFT